MSKKCINCGTMLNDNDKFCGECGSKQPEAASVCPNCNKEVPAGSKFCSECGTPLQAGTSPAPTLVSNYPDCTVSQPDDDTIAITIMGVTFNMKLVEGGRHDEKTQVSDFYIGETVVTQELWQMVMGDNPSKDNRDMQLPVTDVNPAKCNAFFNKLLKITGVHFDFPTIYQWEYAHDGGRKATRKTKYAGSDVIDEVAWTVDNSSNEIQPVALLKANELGLYDMDGNVREYCKGEYCETADYRFNPAHDECAVSNGFSAQRNNPEGLRFVINVPISEHILTKKTDNASIFSPAIEKDSPLHDALCRQQQRQDDHLQKEIDEEKAREQQARDMVEVRYYECHSDSSKKEAVITGVKSVYKETLKEYTIPEGITSIGMAAFRDCPSLTSIIIPKSVTEIIEAAFQGCKSLTSVTIPNSVTKIGEWAFEDCSGLTSLTISNSVTKIEGWAFQGCKSLTSVTIPNSVTSIGERAFEGCSGLTSLTISNSVTKIGEWAFLNCESLTSITIPKSVTEIKRGAFKGCKRLKRIHISASIDSIPEDCFFGCQELENVKLPDSVTEIESWAFCECKKLKKIKLPSKLKVIDRLAFYESGLEDIKIPKNVR